MAAKLTRRIRNVGSNQAQAMGGYHPATTAATPVEMPHYQLAYAPNQAYPWVTGQYQELTPMWAPDGALVAARTPGWWDQIGAARTPHRGGWATKPR